MRYSLVKKPIDYEVHTAALIELFNVQARLIYLIELLLRLSAIVLIVFVKIYTCIAQGCIGASTVICCQLSK